jgi:hypothetical protein
MADFESLHKKARKVLGEVLDPSERILIAQNGLDAALVATDRRIIVCKWGIASGLKPLASQVNSWPLAEISDVQYTRVPYKQDSIVVHVPGLTPITKFSFGNTGPDSVMEAPNGLLLKGKEDWEALAASLRQLVADHQSAGA